MTIQKIDHINIIAPQPLLKIGRDFYVKVLGFEEGFRPDFSIPGYWLYQGKQAIIHLAESDEESRVPSQNGYLDHISFLCDDFDSVLNTLNKNNISFDKVTVPGTKACQLIFHDPSGLKFELLFHPDNSNK